MNQHVDSKKTTNVISVGTIALVVVAGLLGAGADRYLMTRPHPGAIAGSIAAPTDLDMTPVWKAWETIDEKFVPASVASTTPIATSTEKRNQDRVYGMVGGLAASLNDPYTFFLPPTQDTEFTTEMNGSFEGVGMEIAVKNRILTVVSPLKDTPSDKAGIKSDDQILKINGVDTKNIEVNDAIMKIRGPRGTTVVLTVMRAGFSAPREISIVRDIINIPIVKTTKRSDGVYVISVATFTATAPDLFRNALKDFVASGDTKLILDLRGNPGGYLEAAVDMASWFLPSGKVVVTEDYAGHKDNVVHRSLGYNLFNSKLKMVILVDHGSASASEILSDALRYWGVAKLVGVNTYGKGSVQELVPITADTSLKLTVARWLGPDGIQIPLSGIIPDFEVPISDADVKAKKDSQMDKAVQLLKSDSM